MLLPQKVKPFNITLLQLSDEELSRLKEVSSLSIFDSTKELFHPEGLFSDAIFGPVGSEARMNKFAYIDLKVPVIHPVVYKALTQAKKFYTDILNGSAYARFSFKEKDFVKSDPIEGQTGYHFFISNFENIVIKDTNTQRRKQTIELFNRFKSVAIIDKVPVMPAGLRDVEFEDGGPSFDEINQFYKKLISLANNISPMVLELDPSMVDKTRYRIQEALNLLYDNISQRVEGKKKFYLAKWASRRIFNGTRNVIVATKPSGRYLKDKNNVGYNDTVVGLYQAMKAILPVTIHHLQNSVLREIFADVSESVELINPQTYELEKVEVDSKVFDYYQSVEGLESFITDYKDVELRHRPIKIGEHYLLLTYLSDKGFKLFRDIKDLPPEIDKSMLRPTTYTEFFYSVMYKYINNYPAIVVRYPITGPESTVPSQTHVFTTVKGLRRYELQDDFSLIEDEAFLAPEFPIYGERTMEAMSPPVSALSGLNADFDGDTSSFSALYTDEAIQEIAQLLNQKRAYITPTGKFIKSCGTDTVEYVLHNLSS